MSSDSATVYAATSSTLNFQGRLFQANGAVVPDGFYNIEFKLYDGGTQGGPAGTGQTNAGTLLWTETRYDTNGVSAGNDSRVRVVNGYFTVNLGSLTAFPTTVKWDQELWVTMNVGGATQTATPTYDGEMLASGNARTKLTAVPYAFKAAEAKKLIEEQLSGTGTLEFLTLTQNRTINLPDANGTVLLDSTGFANGGNTFSGGTATLGVNDSNDLILETNNSERFRIDQSGNVSVGTGADGLEKLDVAGGVRIGNSTNTNAGTLRWTGTDFEGYDGTTWKSLTLGSSQSASAGFVSGLANVGANVTGTAVETLVFTSATAVSNTAGITGFTAPTSGSFSTCLVKNNANITAGTLNLRWRVNGSSVGASACTMSTSKPRESSSALPTGTVTFQAGDTIGVAFDTVGLAPTTNDFTVYWTVQYNTGGNSGQAFTQGGNIFGTTATLGTNDNQAISIITNNVERANITSAGIFNILNGLSVANGLTLSSGDLSLTTGGLQLNGTSVITSAGVLQNVTASTGILTSGQLGVARGGTGIDSSAAANGQLLIGNGAGFSLGTITNNGGLAVTPGAGTLGLSVAYGASANTAVQGNTTFTCASGTGNLTGGGGGAQALGGGITCGDITTNNAVTFTTSVTTPIITSAGGLSLRSTATAGADDVIFETAGTEKLRLLENGDLRFEKGTNDVTFAVDTPASAAATYTFTGTSGTVLTTSNFAAIGLDTSYVNTNESPAAGDISGSFGAGLTINANSVALGTDTVGDYIANLGTVTGLSLSANSGEGSTPGLTVLYGSGANTAVQGNTTFTCASGTGNLTGGGGGAQALGGGITCGNISTNNAVSFTTSVTTPLLVNAGGLTVRTTATAGADDIIFETAGTEKLRILENGRLTFGTGANNANLYLSANDTLHTDDLFEAGSGINVAAGNFSQAGSGTFATGSGAVGLNGVTTISTSTNSATALTVNGTTGTAATALNIVQGGNAANLTLTNTARTAGALISMTQSTSAFTGTGLLFNFASGSGSFASGNFLDFQLNGTSRFKVDNTGALLITTGSAEGLNIENTSGLSYFSVDVANAAVRVGSATADAVATLMVLDTKNTNGDPTGINGGSYYNSNNGKARCYENSQWTDCITRSVNGETTLGAAAGTIMVTVAGSQTGDLQCRLNVKGRSAAGQVYMRFNGDTGNNYAWNGYVKTGTAVGDGEATQVAQISLTVGQTGNSPFTSTIQVGNFADVRKAITWSGTGADAVAVLTYPNYYSGSGVWGNTTNQITSVSFVTSTGTFNVGSQAYCEGRNTR